MLTEVFFSSIEIFNHIALRVDNVNIKCIFQRFIILH